MSRQGLDGLQLLENTTLTPLLEHVLPLADAMKHGWKWSKFYSTSRNESSKERWSKFYSTGGRNDSEKVCKLSTFLLLFLCFDL
jgi:hypothetical protein